MLVSWNFKTMMSKYLTFSISIAVISWMVGMMMRAVIRKTGFYQQHLSNLNFIPNETLNRVIGLPLFKWVVKNTFFKFFNQKLTIKKRLEPMDLIKLRNEMTTSEIDHLIGFVFVTIFAIVKLLHSSYLFGLTIMIINILLNLYPSLLQQQNKRRIDRLIKHI